MLKAVENLIYAANIGRKSARQGNHWMQVENGVIRYYYHNTAICTIKDGRAVYNNGGWGTTSTTRAINSYKSYYGE